MRTLKGRYTNFFRDREVWTGSLVTGGSPTTMAEAVAEIVTLHHATPDLVYWQTIVEHDSPDGGTVVSAIDLSAHVRDALDAEHDDADTDRPGGLNGMEKAA